ncbi:MAG: hypothetical protein JO162_01645, partial [Alphaproteobacteria bacterium]|nr:hypothetical protein [Alphaproteobacteria bacterium]
LSAEGAAAAGDEFGKCVLGLGAAHDPGRVVALGRPLLFEVLRLLLQQQRLYPDDRGAVSGIKRLLLRQMAQDLEGQWREEREFAKNEFANAKAEDAFPEFIARRGRPLS